MHVVLQVCPGSLYEGGLRFKVELGNISGSPGQKSQQAEPPVFGSGAQDASEKGSEGGGKGEAAAVKELAWVPLVHAPANTDYPAVLIRQPLQPAAPPTPAVDWRVGERVEVSQHLLNKHVFVSGDTATTHCNASRADKAGECTGASSAPSQGRVI